jgi:hypothetical protein
MKYIITESKMENMIKDYILNDDNNVVDVEFGAQRVMLGSGPNEKGETIVTQKVIMVTFDNVKNKKTSGKLRESTEKIAKTLEGLFGIDFRNYGSEWALKFYQIKKEEL